MVIMDFNRYMSEESPFIEAPFSDKQHNFAIPFLQHNKQYTINDNDVWRQYSANSQMPEQGWKIHISSSLVNCPEVLNITARVCSQQDVTFKFLKSREVALSQYAKYADRAQSGKFITIYPKDDAEFIKLLGILSGKLKGISSPPILTDINVPGTPVFFRYGAFIRLMMLDENGHHTPALRNPEGELIPDIRSTQFEMPDFVTPPPQIAKLIQDSMHPTDNLLADLLDGFEVEEALHFSNSGGIYRLKKQDTGQAVVMKEGRSLLGIDGNGNDGYVRIEHEFSILRALQDVKGVVNPIKLSHAAENNYLFEEFVTGTSLHEWQSHNYPFSFEADTGEYEKKALRIIARLQEIVEDVHAAGICLYDLQPRNIMLDDNLNITLIDMESSTVCDDAREAPMGTPGFIPHTYCAPIQVDRYSLMQVAMSLFVPIMPTQSLTDSYWSTEIQFVKRHFSSTAVHLLQAIRRTVLPTTIENSSKVISSKAPLPVFNHLSDLRTRLIAGIHASRRATHPIYHADVIQYEFSQAQLDIGNGLAGVMYALGPQDSNSAADLAELKQSSLNCDFADFGLYSGALGIASMLAERGEARASEHLVSRFIDKGVTTDNISIRSGLAGQYIALHNMRRLCKTKTVETAYEQVFDALLHCDVNFLKATQLHGVSNNNGAGLFDGYSGIAIALFLASHESEGKAELLLHMAEDALTLELDSLEIGKDGSAQVLDENRLLPYLAEGSGGVALAINVLDPHLRQERNREFMHRILKACNVRLSVNGGLMYGYTGLLGVLAQCATNPNIVKDNMESLPLYLFDDKHNNQLFVGDTGQAMSCGYSDGAAGAIALLNYMTGKATSWVYGVPANPLKI